MEFINKIELQGNVGQVKVSAINDGEVANFSVVTESMHQGNGSSFPVVETTWFNVVAFRTKDSESRVVDLSKIQKGKPVHVIGRIRQRKYTTAEGEERRTTEVVAYSVSLPLADDLP